MRNKLGSHKFLSGLVALMGVLALSAAFALTANAASQDITVTKEANYSGNPNSTVVSWTVTVFNNSGETVDVSVTSDKIEYIFKAGVKDDSTAGPDFSVLDDAALDDGDSTAETKANPELGGGNCTGAGAGAKAYRNVITVDVDGKSFVTRSESISCKTDRERVEKGGRNDE